MCLRSTPRRDRDGSEVRYLQLAHNAWDPAAKRSRVQVVCNFGREDAADREALARLAGSVSRFLEPGKALAAAAGEGLEFAGSRPLGGTWVLDALWDRSGIGAMMRRLLRGRRLDPSAGRVLFALVANRALAPSSKLAAARWVSEDAWITGLAETSDDACYRAMDWLLEVRDELEREVFGQVADLLDLEAGLLFFDTASTCFETGGEDEPAWRDEHGQPVPGGGPGEAGPPGEGEGEGGGRRGAGRVPGVRQVQGPPRRPAPGRHRHGGHPRRDPGPGLVLARRCRRLEADPPGQGRDAGLDAGQDHLGRRPRLQLPGQPPLPAARRPPLHHRGQAPLRIRRGQGRPVTAGPVPGGRGEPAGQGSQDQ